jgi:hypothetical protein
VEIHVPSRDETGGEAIAVADSEIFHDAAALAARTYLAAHDHDVARVDQLLEDPSGNPIELIQPAGT